MEAANLPSFPFSPSQLSYFDPGTRLLARENFGTTSLDGDWSFIQIGPLDEVIPVDVDHTFVEACRPRDKSNPIAELVNGKAAQALFAQG